MLKKAQAATGVVVFLFLAVHLVNTYLAAFGPALYDGFQGAVRQVYQQWIIEALLMAALVIHLGIGVYRMLSERGRHRSPRSRWHRNAGLFLGLFIAGHILAVRGPSWFLGIYPGFEGLAFSIDYVPLYFFPYYFLLGVAGLYHGVNGLSIALPRLGARWTLAPGALQATTALGALLTVLALLGLYGVWTDVGDPYGSDFARLALEWVDEYAP